MTAVRPSDLETLVSPRQRLFCVLREGLWWDGWDSQSKIDCWSKELGNACLFTRRASASRVARRARGQLVELVPQITRRA